MGKGNSCPGPKGVRMNWGYIRAGKRTIPLSKSRRPVAKGWPNVELSEDRIEGNFGWVLDHTDLVVDVDPRNGGLEGLEALNKDLGGDLRQATGAVVLTSDRGSGPGFHLYFRKPAKAFVRQNVARYPGIDFKHSVGYVVGVGSVHEKTGESYRWDDNCGFGGITEAPPRLLELIQGQESLSVKRDLGKPIPPSSDDAVQKFSDYLSVVVGPVLEQDDKSGYQVACVAHDYGLSPRQALDCLLEWDRGNSPGWGEELLRTKIINAYKYAQNALGCRAKTDSQPKKNYGKNAAENARIFLEDVFPGDGLRHKSGRFYAFKPTGWECIEKEELEAIVQLAMEFSGVSQSIVNSTILAVTRKIFYLEFVQNLNLLSFSDKVLNLSDPRNPKPLAISPDVMALNCHKFRLSELDSALCPTWLKFLAEVFDCDEERIKLLQEWFGYNLVADQRFQKIMVLLGVSRSGKGVIARMLERVVSPKAFAGLSLSGLVEPFGLSLLIDKKAAVIADAHHAPKGFQDRAKEILLNVSGGDTITINRKFKELESLRLDAKITLVANDLPDFSDGADALINRYLILNFEKSFAGQEDFTLDSRLSEELPGVLAWGLVGLKSLYERGGFAQPKSAKQYQSDIAAVNNPVSVFLESMIELDPGHTFGVLSNDLYSQFLYFCKKSGYQGMSSNMFFRNFKPKVLGWGAFVKKVGRSKRTTYFGLRIIDEVEPICMKEPI